MEYVDTHTHLSDEAYAPEEDSAVERAVAAGVTRLIQADTGSEDREAMYALCERHPGVCFPMLGIYPGNVGPDWRKDVDALAEWRSRGPVAIGEIGLEYHYSPQTAELQKEALLSQLELARDWNLPVNIHLRDATEDWFAIMDKCRGMGLRGNLHCFSGSAEVFERMQRYGEWYVGIGGLLTFKNARIATDILRIPMDRILLETDAPYLAPIPFRGRRNESSYIPYIGRYLAAIKGLTEEETAAQTTANARKLFAI